MKQYLGIGASEGAVVGRTVVFRHSAKTLTEEQSSFNIDIPAEMDRFRVGVKKTAADFKELAAEAMIKFGKEDSGIFEGYIEILCDDEIEEKVLGLIGNGRKAEFAAITAFAEIAAEFAELEGDYISERASDIEDIGRRLSASISGREIETLPLLTKSCIFVADDLSPAETIRLDLSHLQGLIVDKGGATSHVVILARSLGIPCIVGSGSVAVDSENGILCAMDGNTGSIILNPDKKTEEKYRRIGDIQSAERNRLRQSANLPATTIDGVTILVYANIGSSDEAMKVRSDGADGVGLFRTEFLYMDEEKLPDESQQYNAYKKAVEGLGGFPLVIRSFDIGGDKDLPAFDLAKEDNPFLGYRAIRIGMDRPDIFKPQLRAILRAAVHGPIELMFPMIISVDELRSLKYLLSICRDELKSEGISTPTIPVGIMVETPAAALMAEELAKEADFFSLGTNDLTQYTLAVDRGNLKISSLYDPCNPAVVRLIYATSKAALSANISTCICGELGSDLLAIPLLLGLGLTKFSVSSAKIPAVKALIRSLNTEDCKKLALQALSMGTTGEIRKILKEFS